MIFRVSLELYLITFLILMVKLTHGGTVTKDIVINNLAHKIIGSSLSINGVNIEYYGKIPYATPPVGLLRFKYPQEIKGQAWTGVYNSTTQPSTCWQADGGDFDKLNPAARLWLSKTPMSEDCLYLSIWVPTNSTGLLPVMVWIYGGSFFSGSSTLEVYDGSILAARSNVIVVSLQYRIGPLGFMYLDDNLSPGNQGLMDQNLALKWVKNNINNFNGDNGKITIFGESAGSASVSLHVLSPVADGLFNRAIMESGTGLSPWVMETKQDSKTKAIELAKYVNCGSVIADVTQLVNCFIGVDPSALSNSQFNLKEFVTKQRVALLQQRGVTDFVTDGSYFAEFYFRPIYDNFYIPQPIPTLLKAQSANKNVDLLMGFNKNEGMYFLLYGLNTWLKFFDKGNVLTPDGLSSTSPNFINASKLIIENLMNPKYAYKSLVPQMMYEYQVPTDMLGYKAWDSFQVMAGLDQMTADELFVCPVIDYAESMADNKRNVFLYNFRHMTNNVTFPKWVGVMHGYEIEYVFGMAFSDLFKTLYYSFTDEERTLSDAVMTMWTNFAKYGNPTPTPMPYFNQTVTWLPYNTTNPNTFHIEISQDLPFRVNPKSRQCKFWSKVLPSIVEDLSKSLVTVSNTSNTSKTAVTTWPTMTWSTMTISSLMLSIRLW